MRIRFCYDPEGVVAFLEAQGYPLLDLHRDNIKNCTTLSIVSTDGDVVGYIWATWVQDSDMVLALHTCLAEDWKGHWLNRTIMLDMVSFCRLMGAKNVLCSPIYEDIGKQLARMGLLKTPIGYMMKIN